MMKVARGVPRVGIKLPLWFTLFTVWSMQAVARKEGRDGGKEGGGCFWGDNRNTSLFNSDSLNLSAKFFP